MDMSKKKNESRIRRKIRGRKKINGSPERPRLCIYRSNTNWYAQIIDDIGHAVLVAANTLQKDVREGLDSTSNKDAARKLGEIIGKRALEKNITTVVFDKSGFRYHGRVKILADAAREAGLQF